MPEIDSLEYIFDEVREERKSQDVIHPWGNLKIEFDSMPRHYHVEREDYYKKINDFNEKFHQKAYVNVLLLEEYHEIFAETDPIKQEQELIQLISLGVKALQYLRAKRK